MARDADCCHPANMIEERLWNNKRSERETLTSNIVDDYLRRFCSFRLLRIVTFT